MGTCRGQRQVTHCCPHLILKLSPVRVAVPTSWAAGVGTVVAGTVKRGVIAPSTQLLMGPDIADGSFKPVVCAGNDGLRWPVVVVGTLLLLLLLLLLAHSLPRCGPSGTQADLVYLQNLLASHTMPNFRPHSFVPCQLDQVVKSVHYKRLPVGRVVAGQTAALALKKVKRTQVGRSSAALLARFTMQQCWSVQCLQAALLGHMHAG